MVYSRDERGTTRVVYPAGIGTTIWRMILASSHTLGTPGTLPAPRMPLVEYTLLDCRLLDDGALGSRPRVYPGWENFSHPGLLFPV